MTAQASAVSKAKYFIESTRVDRSFPGTDTLDYACIRVHALPRPKAIVCISAHWETRSTRVTAMERPRTIHDFSGFPLELYEVQYPAPGDPALARTMRERVGGVEIGLDQSWGLDHGTWDRLDEAEFGYDWAIEAKVSITCRCSTRWRSRTRTNESNH